MQRLEVSGAVRPIYGSLGVKRLTKHSLLLFKVRGRSSITDAGKRDDRLSSAFELKC